MTPLLQIHLANLLDVSFQARLAHWNVRGPNFSGLHELFGEAYNTLAKQSDDVAERIAQLGAIVDGTVNYVLKTTTYPDSKKSADNNYLTTQVAGRLQALAKDGVNLFNAATKAGDHVTANLIIDQSQDLEKLSWLIRSHIAN